MWCYSTFLLLVGAALAQHNLWEPGNTYKFLVRSRTLVGLDELSNQVSGIQLKATLLVEPQSPDKLLAVLVNPLYAHIREEKLNAWDTPNLDEKFNYEKLPTLGKPFEIQSQNGNVKKLTVDLKTSVWEMNILKSIVSQLQMDMRPLHNKRGEFQDDLSYAMYNVTEDSLDGRCRYLCDVTPMSEYDSAYEPQLASLPEDIKDRPIINIIKTKDYSTCEKEPKKILHVFLKNAQRLKWNKYITKSSSNRMILAKKKESDSHIILSSVRTSKIFIRPKTNDFESNNVFSFMNLTLIHFGKAESQLILPENVISSNNLIYTSYKQHEDDDESLNLENAKLLVSVESNSLENSSEEKSLLKAPLTDGRDMIFPPNMLKDVRNNVNEIKLSKQLINEIIEEIEEPNDLLRKGTLEKFTFLTKLIRQMNLQQLSELEKLLNISPNQIQKDSIKDNKAWQIMRDAVTQAGTKSALATIKKWLEEKLLSGLEAQMVITKLPRAMRVPSDEYTKLFFEMIKLPEVKEELLVDVVAPYAFTKVLHLNNVAKKRDYYVPSSEEEDLPNMLPDVEMYLSYLIEEMEKALVDGHNSHAQAYIRGLSNIVHVRVLKAFEPYLEGKKPATNLQRILMMSGLNQLSLKKPDIARPIFYKLYVNPDENPELRSVAVYFLMQTNLPLPMLSRMAASTRYERSAMVNNAIKSSIENIMTLSNSEDREMAMKARLVRKLLNNRNINTFTMSRMKQVTFDNKDISYKGLLNIVGNRWLPKLMLLDLEKSVSDFKFHDFKVAYMVSDLNDLWEKVQQFKAQLIPDVDSNLRQYGKSMVQDLASSIKMSPESVPPFELFVSTNNIFETKSLSIDEQTLLKLYKEFMTYVQSFGQNKKLNLNQISSYDMQLSFPTETGFPFKYEYTVSKLNGLRGEVKFQADSKQPFQVDANLKPVHSMKTMLRSIFMTPHNMKEYVAAVDVNLQLYLPMKLNLEYKKHALQIEYEPTEGNVKNKLVHYGVIPFITDRYSYELKSMSSDKEFRPLYWDKPTTLKSKLGSFILERITDNFKETVLAKSEILVNPIPFMSIHYNELNLYNDVDSKEDNTIRIKVDHRKFIPKEIRLVQFSKLSGLPSDEIPNVDKWKALLLEDIGNVKVSSNELLDISAEVPGWDAKIGCTLGLLSSNEDNVDAPYALCKYKTATKEKNNEMCIYGKLNAHQFGLSNVNQSPEKEDNNFLINVQVGNECTSGWNMKIEGDVSQSEQLKETINVLEQKCENRGENPYDDSSKSNTCKSLRLMSNMPDTLSMRSVTSVINDITKGIIKGGNVVKVITDIIMDAISSKGKKGATETIDLSDNKSGNQKNMKLMLSPDFHNVDINIDDSKSSNAFSVNIPEFVRFVGLQASDVWLPDNKDVCTVNGNTIVTFDNKDYQANVKNCWHVMVIPIPQKEYIRLRDRNKDYNENSLTNSYIPKSMNVAILIREKDDGNKHVKVLLNDNIISLDSEGQRQQIQVQANNQIYDVKEGASFQNVADDLEPQIQIKRNNKGLVSVLLKSHQIRMLYDGKAVQIKASEKYNGKIRGLCGNKDQNKDNEFVSPNKCLISRAEEIVASYALTDKECSGPALAIKKKYKDKKCIQSSVIENDAVDLKEILRNLLRTPKFVYIPQTECNIYKTRAYDVEGKKTCFSIRPVLKCNKNCVATELVNKEIKVHCMRKSEASEVLRQRILAGANPDLSHESVSTVLNEEIPAGCVPQ